MMITVIVPIYKVEKYLQRCLDSILAQRHTDFELLLIDDGSPDNCGAICEEYSERDPRIHVFHKENGGVSSARNLGIDHAKGEWIAFVDGDDYLEPSYLEDLAAGILTEGVGMIFQGHRQVDGSGEQVRLVTVPNVLVSTHSERSLFDTHPIHLFGAPWSKLYSNALIVKYNLRFDETIHFGEDLLFMISYLSKSDWCHFMDKSNYNYNIGVEGSLSGRKYDFHTEYHTLQELTAQGEELIKQFNITHSGSTAWRAFLKSFVHRTMSAIYNSNLTRPERVRLLRLLLTSENRELITERFPNARRGGSPLSRFLLRRGYVTLYDLYKGR